MEWNVYRDFALWLRESIFYSMNNRYFLSRYLYPPPPLITFFWIVFFCSVLFYFFLFSSFFFFSSGVLEPWEPCYVTVSIRAIDSWLSLVADCYTPLLISFFLEILLSPISILSFLIGILLSVFFSWFSLKIPYSFSENKSFPYQSFSWSLVIKITKSWKCNLGSKSFSNWKMQLVRSLRRDLEDTWSWWIRK